MDEQEKNPRLRFFKDLSPEAQAARRADLDILESDDGVQAGSGNLLALAEAAARLGCTLNDLLDEALGDECEGRTIYAPVLDEALYAWPVTDRGMPHSKVIGMAFPIFRERFASKDMGILLKSDIEQMKKGAPVIPDGYIFPNITLRCIDAWEAEQASSIVLERMREQAKTVAWIHPSKLKSERGDWPLPTRYLSVDMLMVDAEGIPEPRPLTIAQLASAFELYLGKTQTKRTVSDWVKIFKKPNKKILSAKIPTTQGKEGEWKPVEAGLALHEHYEYSWPDLNRAFRQHELLRLWWSEWIKATTPRGNDKVDVFERGTSPTSPFDL
ncbi:hypothetical protein [Burkholderia sp. 22PA0106]|uniref:hypothetical protein n=1 Tax=Burkholderia sp. 22PA0106 TaxID=3237371 RepID=UPI0039C256D7